MGLRRIPAPEELRAFADANGWRVIECLPARYSAFATVNDNGCDLFISQETSTGEWTWLTDPGRDWGRGHKRGRAGSLRLAAQSARTAAAKITSTLF